MPVLARSNHAGQSVALGNGLWRADSKIERLLLAVGKYVPGVDAIDNPVGQCLLSQRGAGVNQVGEDQACRERWASLREW